MISLIILAQEDMAKGLLNAIEHVLGRIPPGLDIQPIAYHQPQEELAAALGERIRRLDQGEGVLILADVYGSSHTNAACRLLASGRVELVSGVNVPMLLRVLSYRTLSMDELLRKAMSGGTEGIVRAALPASCPEAGR
jgi:PTS system ascorbate-specific IIA component